MELENNEGLDFNMSFLNEENEETTQESETESLYDEDVTVLDSEEDLSELDETEEEPEELEDEESEELEDEEDFEVSYTPFVEPLIESGLLYIDEDKEYDDSPEGFQEILQDTITHRLQETVSQLPEVLQKVFELSELGEDPRAAFENLNTFDYSQVDIEDVDNQKSLVEELVSSRFPEWSAERLTKYIQNLEDLGELEDEAKLAQEALIKSSEAQREEYEESVRLAREESIKAQEQEYNEYVSLIDNAEGFNGIKFTSNQQRDAFKKYTFERGEDGLTQYERETKAKEDQLSLAWIRFNKQNTMESIQRKAVTKASLEQKKILKRLGQEDRNAKSGKNYADRQAKPNSGFYVPSVEHLQ